MKMKSTIFSLMIGLSVISVVQLNAQTRGRDRDGDRELSDSRDRSDRSDRNDRDRGTNRDYRDRRDTHDWKNDRNHDRGNHYGRNNHRHHHDYDRRVVVRHVHDRYCHRRPVVVHHHHTRPRYVYYRDYDVYYDYSRNVYFSYSGRSWSMSTGIPIGMRNVNLRAVKRYEVDYYDDDFGNYLDNGRPAYGKECDW